MQKAIEELKKMSTKNLLAYYRAERKRYNVALAPYYWGFDKVDLIWDIEEKFKEEKEYFQIWQQYLNLIKSLLDKRENI